MGALEADLTKALLAQSTTATTAGAPQAAAPTSPASRTGLLLFFAVYGGLLLALIGHAVVLRYQVRACMDRRTRASIEASPAGMPRSFERA